MAIVFPLLVMLMLGLLEFSLYYYARNVVETAAQEGAHAAAALNADLSSRHDRGVARANDVLRAGGRKAGEVDIDFGVINNDDVVIAHTVNNPEFETFIPRFGLAGGKSRVTLPLDTTVKVSIEKFRGAK
jgi:Flp pilus assembly protein TadG